MIEGQQNNEVPTVVATAIGVDKSADFVVQGGFDPSQKSGVGADFELLVRCLLLENKVEARKPSMMSLFKPDTYRFEHRGS